MMRVNAVAPNKRLGKSVIADIKAKICKESEYSCPPSCPGTTDNAGRPTLGICWAKAVMGSKQQPKKTKAPQYLGAKVGVWDGRLLRIASRNLWRDLGRDIQGRCALFTL